MITPVRRDPRTSGSLSSRSVVFLFCLVIGVWLTAGAQEAANPAPAVGAAGSGGVYRIGGEVLAPHILKQFSPEYSEVAKKLRVAGGTVVVKFVVGVDGIPRDFAVTTSAGYGLDEKAIEAVGKWRFEPATKSGMPVPSGFTFNTRFPAEPNGLAWGAGRMVFENESGVADPEVTDGTMPKPGRAPGKESVVLAFTVDSGGSVQNVRRVEGSGDSSRLLAEYLSKWKFRPAMKGNIPIQAIGRVRFVIGEGMEAANLPLSLDEPPKEVLSRLVTPAEPEHTASAESGQAHLLVNPSDYEAYVWIPPGTFTMGCSPGDQECNEHPEIGFSDAERPTHQVTITKGFWIGQTPVTQDAYQRSMERTRATSKEQSFRWSR